MKGDPSNERYSVRSTTSIGGTADRLREELKERDIAIFAEIDHALQAERVEMDYCPNWASMAKSGPNAKMSLLQARYT